jgi:endoglucanase
MNQTSKMIVDIVNSPGTDAAASASAAFSMCSMLYSNTTLSTFSQPSTLLSDQNYSTTLLLHASDLYTFASSNPSSYRTYIQSNPALGDTYPSSGYQDDLTLAALALGIATNSSQLISSANSFYSKYSLSSQNGVLNWDSKTPMISILFSQSAFANGGDNKWQVESERYLDNIITISKGKKGQGGGYLTKGGLLYYPGDSDEASLNPALNAAMLMGHYAPMASTKDKGAAYMVCFGDLHFSN